MANKLYEEDSIKSIADAIRTKGGTARTYTVAEMATAILALSTGDGGIAPSGSVEITTNGTHDVTNYASAIVNVASDSEASSLPSTVKVGVLHLDSDTTTAVTVNHGCGATPRVVTCFSLGFIGVKATVGGVYIEGAVIGASSNDDIGTKSFSVAVKAIDNVTETSFDFVPRSASYPLIGGFDYFWVAMS